VAVLLFALMVLAVPLSATAVTPAIGVPEDGLGGGIDAMNQLATDSRNNKKQKSTTRPTKGLPVKLGKDGRLTVLLIGSDWREDSGGERLDVLMVATIDPATGRSAIVSIPRDMGGIPFAGGGSSGGMRVNSIYYIRYRDNSLPHEAVDRQALKRFSKDIGKLLGTQIDYWALTRFGTFSNLVNALGGLRVDIDDEVRDSYYHSRRSRGIFFPAKDDYKLRGDPACKPFPARCHSALAFARSRHGTSGSGYNSDYTRAARQQEMVRAAVKGILDEGSGTALLARLLKVRDKIDTNLPKTIEAGAQLYALVEGMKLNKADMKVLAPSTWASTASDGTIRPNLSRIRAFVDRAFYPVKARNGKKDR